MFPNNNKAVAAAKVIKNTGTNNQCNIWRSPITNYWKCATSTIRPPMTSHKLDVVFNVAMLLPILYKLITKVSLKII